MTDRDQLLEQLRAELAERSPCEAGTCPSWPTYLRWLREHGPTDVGEWLALTLAGRRRPGDRGRLLATTNRTLDRIGEEARRVWNGELGWSLWFGPFVLAYVGEPPPDLGPLATFLLPERALIDGDPDRWMLADLERDEPLLLTRTLPDSQEPIADHLHRELREHYGRHAVGAREVSWQIRRWRIPPEPIEGAYGLLSCATGPSLSNLHWPSVQALEAAAIVGPPELVQRWPNHGRERAILGPLPSFERRHAELGAAAPALIGRLRAELDERPIHAAHECPTWPVYVDWLLDHGHELLAEWLRAALAVANADAGRRLDRTKLRSLGDRMLSHELAPARAVEQRRLTELWSETWQPNHARATWLGPFMLEYVDPGLVDGLGRDELQATLGELATLLSPDRVYTDVDWTWVEQALLFRDTPTLAPAPAPSLLFALSLAELAGRDDDIAEPALRVRVTAPGERVERFPERTMATNIGPIAADSEATAIICCETAADVERHSADWLALQDYERVVLIARPELLARWRHPGVRIEPYRARPED